MKFKIGDRVKTLTDEGSDWDTGSEHVITKDYLSGGYELDGSEYWTSSEIELVSIDEEPEEHFDELQV